MDHPLRHLEPPEKIEMHAHEGECRYCKTEWGAPGMVKMWRNTISFDLMPDKCSCLLCGQRYYVVTEDIDEWFRQQTLEKYEEEEKS